MTNHQQIVSVLLGVAAGLGAASKCCAGCPINVPADFPTIQAAIDAGGCEIIVAPGTYNEIISNFGIVRSSDGPDVTIIDGSGFNSTVVTCTTGCGTLEGFTITGGNGGGNQGGGWFNMNSSPTVINCSFSENSAWGGGAMRNDGISHPTLIDCTFTGNTASNSGGAIFNSVNTFPTITNCFFGGNSAASLGGAIYNPQGAYPVITDSLFCENTPDNIYGPYDDGGGNDGSSNCDLLLDCNENGIYDWIEIQKGLAQDVNGNGIPDECELFPADITGPLGGVPDGCVDAFDLGAMLGAWCSAVNDPNPPSPPCENCIPANLDLADISGAASLPDGCVDAFDLAKLLADWCSVAGGNPCGTCL